ncbi:MAG: ribonuclease III [Armatimonadetes bacterium]|nr:ribonuclease III [Armatimonadota bacterium]
MRTEDELRGLCQRLGIEAGDIELVRLALTHPSWVDDMGQGKPADNQRLEFLGDAILGALVAEYLYRALPDEDEGELTRLKSEAVRRDTLAAAAQRVGLSELILLGPPEQRSGGWHKPSILADCLEALIGAVYLSGGFDAARQLVERLLGDELHRLTVERTALDPKTELQQLLQSLTQRLPKYVTVREDGPPHQRQFEVEVRFDKLTLGRGRGGSKQRAQQAAAHDALRRKEEWLERLSTGENDR